MSPRPPLSLVIPVREGWHEIDAVLEALMPQACGTGCEVIVTGAIAGPAPPGVRAVPMPTGNFFLMRMRGVLAARGEIVAIGEDHAVPRPDWCESVIRAHAEHPEAGAVAGCFVNATSSSLAGRANFLSFAAPFAPPMPVLPTLRPPPVALVSFKRAALSDVDETPGRLEAVILPRLFRERRIAADDRILVDHHQDHGLGWSVTNAFHGARSSYGYQRDRLTPRERRRLAAWSLRHWPPRTWSEAGQASPSAAERAVVGVIGLAVGTGAALGSLTGPGRSPARVA
jgi:hypothetical protein